MIFFGKGCGACMGIQLLILIGCLLFMLNAGIALFIRKNIHNKINLQIEKEKLLHSLQLQEKLYQFIVLLFSAGVSFIGFKLGEQLRFPIYLLALIPFIYITFQLIISKVTFHTLYQQLRSIETTLQEELYAYFRMLGLLFIPAILLIFFRVYFIQNENNAAGLYYLLLLIAVLLFLLLYPYMMKLVLKGKQMEASDIRYTLEMFLKKQHMSSAMLYEFAGKKNKLANAMVAGVFTKKIFFSDYLLDHLTPKEAEAILAHEIGHIKKWHLLIKGICLIAILPLFIGLGYFMDSSESLFNFTIPIPVGIIIMFGGFFSYLGFIFLKLSKIHEYQADKYVIEIGLEKEDFINALRKLAELNDQITEATDLGELLGTHPSMEKRIHKLNEVVDEQKM